MASKTLQNTQGQKFTVEFNMQTKYLYGDILFTVSNYYSNGWCHFVRIHKTLLDSTQWIFNQLKYHKMQMGWNIPVINTERNYKEKEQTQLSYKCTTQTDITISN